MSLSAAASGFVVFLLSVQVVQGHNGWGVTYTSTKICALKGSTVNIHCTYRYPSWINGRDTKIKESFWFTKMNGTDFLDLRTDPEYSDRVEYSCHSKRCTLKIKHLRESDSAEYKFRFTTNQHDGKYTGSPGVTLSVTDPDLQVQISGSLYSTWRKLKCHSICDRLYYSSYVWYKNGQKIQEETSTSSYSGNFDSADSYSCAVKGHEDSPSPPVCVIDQSCNRVTYTDRSICAFKGSSVDISSAYNSHQTIRSKFWFSPERSRQWQSPSQSEDLSEDFQYAGRVQVFETWRGRSTLRITDLRENDSAQYHFKFTAGSFEWNSILPGTTLTVTALQVQVTRIKVHQSYTEAELKCHSSCSPDGRLSYVWFKNGKEIRWPRTSSYKGRFYPTDIISCALKGHQNHLSPSVYAPRVPSVSVSPSGEILEGSSVTLTCSSDANPAATYTWYKKNGNQYLQPPSKEPQLIFRSIQSSDSGEYYCTAENELGRRTSQNISINVKYAPKTPSISVSPHGEIVEGSPLTLNCSSDSNPAPNYTWYKENQTLIHGPKGIFHLTSIRLEDRGIYYCKSENKYGRINSTAVQIDVQYGPKLPSMSVSPSGEIVEGSSVTLTCSSDANPAANYTWYKEDEDSPKASGQNFTITDFRPEHSGNYYCEAQNKRGHHNSTLHQIVMSRSMKSVAAGSITAICLAIIVLSAFLLIRKKRSLKQSTESRKRPDNRAQLNMNSVYANSSAVAQTKPAEDDDDISYASVNFSENQEDSLYSNVRPAQPNRHKHEEEDEDSVEYTPVNFNNSSASPQLRHREAVEDLSSLYSAIIKNPRL